VGDIVRKSLRYVALSLGLASLVAVTAVTASLAAPAQSVVVNPVPSTATPNIQDGETDAITRVGNLIIAGGTFTSVANRSDSSTIIPRQHLLAFDATTGVVSTTFVPDPDKAVNALLPGPTPNTVYVGGNFQKIAGATHPYLVLLDVTTGAVVSTFNPPAINGAVMTMGKMSTTQLILGGIFSTVGGVAHGGLASLNPTTGALTSYMNVQLAGHHNYNGTTNLALASVGATSLAIRAANTQMVVIGNFKTANGSDRDQIVVITLTATTSSIANWETNAFKAACNPAQFDSWIRDVDYSPGGSYFVVAATGGPHTGQDCDSVSEFNSGSTGTGLNPTWIDFSGGDTFLSVVSTGAAIYVGGHFRWLNNPNGLDSAYPGAVGRASIAALDPLTGLPRSWNPGRNPRGYGVTAIYDDSTVDPGTGQQIGGIYMGYDTDYIGNSQYARGKIAYFPVAGGTVPDVSTSATVPGNLYTDGAPVAVPTVLDRISVAGPTVPATDGGPDWLGDTQTSTLNRVANGVISTWPNAPAHGAGPSLPAYAPMALFNAQRAYPTDTPTAWTFSVPAGTTLNVNLFVAQRGWDSSANAPLATQYSVVVNGVVQLANYDPNASIGYNTAGELPSIPVTVPASGTVTIGFDNTTGAAAVNAIELVRTGGTATTYGFYKRAFNGTSLSTTTYSLTQTDTTPFKTNGRGAFAVGNKVFYGLSDGNFYMRTFDGTNLGNPVYVNPYTDPNWDNVQTGSTGGTAMTATYAGIKPDFYAEIPYIRSMFYYANKLYYTRSDSTHLYWRWFTPESGVVGALKNTVAGPAAFANASGVLIISGSKLYFSKTTDGKLYSIPWNGTAPTGTATVLSATHGLSLTAAFLGP
jgi:hypothetical protein